MALRGAPLRGKHTIPLKPLMSNTNHDQAQRPAPWLSCAPRKAREDSRTRFIDKETGMRFYPIPDPTGGLDLVVPGVTSLLSHDATPEELERLRRWREQELAKGRDPDAGRKRGTRVHARLEEYIRTGTLGPPDDEAGLYASGMERYLDSFENFLWSERPLVGDWDHVWTQAGYDVEEEDAGSPKVKARPLARVWSAIWGFAGTPDIIGKHRRHGLVLGDFKSSSRPYYRPARGARVPGHCRTGYLKYKKTVRQLCCYRVAVHETLGILPERLVIYVGLPSQGEAQQFWIDEREVDQETEAIKKTSLAFWSKQWLPAGCLPPPKRRDLDSAGGPAHSHKASAMAA